MQQQQSWILLALIGSALVYEASGLDCVQCNDNTATCVDGTKPAAACEAAVTSCFVKITGGNYHRGCSTAAEEAACSTDDGKECKKCSVNGCNNLIWRKCHKCNGAACTGAQAAADAAFCKNYKNNDKCYERFVDDTTVERGCEADLDPAPADVCQGNQQCKTCTVDGCNSDASYIFQTTKCVQCKTDTNDNDANSVCLKGATAQTDCATLGGKCYSRVDANGVLDRGCRSALSAAEETACVAPSCSLCDEAGCNKEVFPADRLVCNQCQSSDDDKLCATDLTDETKSGICKVYKADDKCYSRVTAAGVFERGCSSSLPAAEQGCAGNNNCLECTGKNCNTLSEQKLRNPAKCQQCDSTNAACLAGTTASVECANKGDSCFVRINGDKLERNCLATLNAADQAKCKDANDLSCVTCTDQDCNNQKWIKCHQCKETTAAACNAAQVDANAAFCPKYKDGNQCYERLESEKVVRGCSSDLSAEACLNNLECRTCTADACNKEEAQTLKTNQRCLQCATTSDADGKCLDGTASSQPCKTESEQKCYRKVDTDGLLERGCKGDMTAAQVTTCTGDLCAICTGTECNKEVFPANRRKCYQCKSSASDLSCTSELQGADKSGYCKLYVAGDKCYSRDVDDDVFERGCQSDLGKSVEACKDIDEKHCESCDSDDCNVISKKKLNSAGAVALNLALMAVAALVAVACTL